MVIRVNIQQKLYLLMMLFGTLVMILGFLHVETNIPFFELSFIMALAMFLVNLYHTIRKVNIVSICAFYILLGIVAIVVNIREIPLALYALIVSVALMQLTLQSEFSLKHLTILTNIALIGSFFLISIFFLQPAYYGITRTIKGANPQMVGCWAYVFSAVAILQYDSCEKCLKKILMLLIVGVMLLISIMCDARGAIIAALFLLVAHFMPQLKNNILQKVVIFAPMIPMLLTYGFIWIWKLQSQQGIADTILTGREILWSNYLKYAQQNPLTGNYIQYSNQYTHNIYVEHVLFYGYPMALIFIAYMSYVVYKNSKKITSRLQYDALMAFIGVLLLSSVENMAMSIGGGAIIIYSYSFLWCVNMKDNSNQKTEINCISQKKVRINIKAENLGNDTRQMRRI